MGRRVGRQQQTMPTLDSTDDHAAAGGLVYVGSGELEIAIRLWRRRMETRHTLGILLGGGAWERAGEEEGERILGREERRRVRVCGKGAYNPPSAKTIISARFCPLGRLSFRSTGMGRMMIAKSVAMLIPAFVNPVRISHLHLLIVNHHSVREGMQLTHSILIDAMSRKGLIPKQGNRRARKDRGEHGPKAVHDDNAEDEATGDAKAPCWEDAQVLQEHAGFCETECEVVDRETAVEGLETGL